MSENFYNILGVTEKATKDEIKRAYRSLQLKWHPDKNNNSQESITMTQQINEAYDTLGNEQKREAHDQMRNNPTPFTRMSSHNGNNINVDDIFNMFFGGAGMPGMPFGMPPGMMQGMPPGMMQGMPPGVKIHVVHNGMPMGFHQTISKPNPIMKTININMEQVLSGASIPIDIERWIMENGIQVYENETIYVTIPQGIDDNEIIHLENKGHIMNQSVKGDVKIGVKIINDTEFKRAGLDLIYEKHISLKEALCGFTFEINYLNGKSYTLNNNKGNIIPPEYKKIYPNMGLTRGEHRGNMIIHFHIDFPEKLSDEQIEKLSDTL